VFVLRLRNQGFSVGESPAKSVVVTRWLSEITNTLRSAHQRIVTVDDSSRRLDFLSTGQPPTGLFSIGRPHVMIEGVDVTSTGSFSHECGTVPVVVLDDRFEVEKVQTRIAQRAAEEFESASLQSAARVALESAAVVDSLHVAIDDDALGPGVTAVSISPREHATIASKRGFETFVEVVEGTLHEESVRHIPERRRATAAHRRERRTPRPGSTRGGHDSVEHGQDAFA